MNNTNYEIDEGCTNWLPLMSLQKVRCDLTKINSKIQDFKRAHDKATPKVHYANIMDQYVTVAERLASTKTELLKLSDEYACLLDEQKNVLTKRDNLLRENTRLRRDRTPRPHWVTKCANSVSFDSNAWSELVRTHSSDQLLDFLLNEFIGGNNCTNTKHELLPQSILPDKTMLYTRPRIGLVIKNMKLGQRDLLIIIRDILAAKYDYNVERKLHDLHEEKLVSFVFLYFRKKYQSKNTAIEWFYNLIDSLDRCKHLSLVKFFKDVLNDDTDENLFHSFIRTTYELHELLAKSASEERPCDDVDHPQHTDFLSAKRFQQDLKTKFPFLTQTDLDDLCSCAYKDSCDMETRCGSIDKDWINYKVLFLEDVDGTNGDFLKCLMVKIDQNRYDYVMSIHTELKNMHSKNMSKCRLIEFSFFNFTLLIILSFLSYFFPVLLDFTKHTKLVNMMISNTDAVQNESKTKKMAKKTSQRLHAPKENKKTNKLKIFLETGKIIDYDCETNLANSKYDADDFVKAILKIDPHISEPELERYVRWIFRRSHDGKSNSLGTFLRDMQNFDCFPHVLPIKVCGTQRVTRTKFALTTETIN
jgi:hypothetical protein